MTGFRPGSAALLAVLLLSGRAPAEPETTAWLEDTSVEEARSTQTAMRFEHQQTDLKAPAEGIDLFTLSLQAGLWDGVALTPALALSQRGEEALRLNDVGLGLRWRAIDTPEWPTLVGYSSYVNDLGDARDHLIRVGLAARYALHDVWFNADVRPTLNLGGELGTALETWYGVAAGYRFGDTWHARVGAEAFMIVPLIGERLSDPSFGEGATSTTAYLGPSFAFEFGRFWTSLAPVTGYGLGTQGSQFMLRWQVGVMHD